LSELENSLYARFVALCERFELVGANLLVIPRDVVGQYKERAGDDSDEEVEAGDEEEDEDEDEDEDEEEEEEEEESEEEPDTRGRGEKGDSKEKRTRSLDRHGPPSSLDMPKAARNGTIMPDPAATPLADDTNAANMDMSPGKEDPFRSSPRAGRGTLGRGKQPRGTMLWTSDMSGVPAIPIGPELSRTESSQTAILIEEPEDTADASGTVVGGGEKAAEEDEDDAVPKDEIELLEESGVLKSEATVSPLPPPQVGGEGGATDTDVIDNVEDVHVDTEEDAKVAEDTAKVTEDEATKTDGKEDGTQVESEKKV
jgi:hypothetical protein